jgi:hypothetical protein
MTTPENFPRPLPRKKKKNKIFTQNKISKLFPNQCFIFLDNVFVVFYTKKNWEFFFSNFFSFSVNWTYFSAFLDFLTKFFTSKLLENKQHYAESRYPQKRKSSHKISKHFPVGKAREEKSFSKNYPELLNKVTL